MSVLLQKLYKAYYSARKQKRNKPEVLRFELEYEKNLYDLYHDIIQEKYVPLPARAFVVRKPVDREIFAPAFRDRVIHHLIYHYLYDYIDQKFIYDNYSCRLGKGTLFGVERAKTFLRKASQNYTRDAYVLKLDVSGYFMNIERETLLHKIHKLVNYDELDITQTEKKALKYLIKVIVLNNVTTNAELKSPKSLWKTIPATKSLFSTLSYCGLPIGALTSQLFSNVYLNDLDHMIKKHCRYYGRYVDDLLIIDTDKEKLIQIIKKIDKELHKIGLKLHPKKIYLQHYSKGFYFLGHFIKPHRCYISRRTKKHIDLFLRTFQNQWNTIIRNETAPSMQQLAEWENRFNSYFGILAQVNAYHYLQKKLQQLPQELKGFVDIVYYKERKQMRMTVKSAYKIKNNYQSLYEKTECL